MHLTLVAPVWQKDALTRLPNGSFQRLIADHPLYPFPVYYCIHRVEETSDPNIFLPATGSADQQRDLCRLSDISRFRLHPRIDLETEAEGDMP
jgi:hypothetical protein